jgi:ribosomal protein S18 acetylase RimI-like enzyme
MGCSERRVVTATSTVKAPYAGGVTPKDHDLDGYTVGAVSALTVSAVRADEQARALATLVLAFTEDPFERWMYPEAGDYLAHFSEFLAAFGGNAFDEQTVWSLGEFAAVALWLPPGTEPDGEAIVRVLTETVSVEKHRDLLTLLDEMDSTHPTYPHWYLPWFGVDTALQGRGLGGQLMEPCLRIVDESHLPAYLESPNPRNVSFYERHGFELTGVAEVGACPPVAFMLRPAQ